MTYARQMLNTCPLTYNVGADLLAITIDALTPMAQPAAMRNVLTALGESPPTSFYWQLTLLATLGGFLFGYDTSNIGSALNFVPYGLHGLA